MSAREQILSACDVKVAPVDVPEWPVPVFVRVMSGKARDEFEKSIVDRRKDKDFTTTGLRALLVCLTACDELGVRFFADSDIPAIEDKSADVLQRIFEASAKLNGLTPAEAEAAKADFTTDRS
jgi:hypothetical protein